MNTLKVTGLHTLKGEFHGAEVLSQAIFINKRSLLVHLLSVSSEASWA